MSKALKEGGNWENQRRTGRFAIDDTYSFEDTQRWLELAGQPPMLEGETDKAYVDRIAAEKDSTILNDEQGER